ncbi:MAG: hypothetical protein MJ057_07230, partial [Sphaerochaetaceae bacterium]|nr:hypothetical protein [Sphaerochaetaceae bacterium]
MFERETAAEMVAVFFHIGLIVAMLSTTPMTSMTPMKIMKRQEGHEMTTISMGIKKPLERPTVLRLQEKELLFLMSHHSELFLSLMCSNLMLFSFSSTR